MVGEHTLLFASATEHIVLSHRAFDRLDHVGGRALPAGIPAQQVRLMEAGIPLGRGGTPEEAANSIYLLCTPESDYISGHVLMVTGGL